MQIELTGRSHPWHSRIPSNQNQIWFRNLIDLHQLTLNWLKAVNVEQPTYVIPRGVQANPEVSSSLWMLDLLGAQGLDSSTELVSLMDDTSPEDVLARLDRTVWAVQSWTLNKLLKGGNEDALKATMNVLEQTSWKCGREISVNRWPDLLPSAREDLRGVLSAFRDNPLSRSTSRQPFLVKRATESEASIDLTHCPHRSPYAEVLPMADPLCRLHGHWIRGYVYAINTRIQVNLLGPEGGCAQRWNL